ncbi:MAG TPA: hypothetical protein VJ849_08815 [Actinomycetes bacterium]|nr:hypothetical protein [Actinomycetes bacterium]
MPFLTAAMKPRHLALAAAGRQSLDSATSDPFVLEPGRRTTQLLPVGTRATGTFPIQVDVLTPDGEVRIAGGEIRLTSTAFNRVALALTGGAAGVLLLWWRFGRRRRAGTEG